jgi:hypothetical protein
MSTNGSVRNSGNHNWEERKEPHLKLESGEAVVQHHCCRCSRDLVTVLSSGARHAVYASVLCFYRLDDEVTKRWLSEPCPGERLASDDEDRRKLNREAHPFVPRAESRLIPKSSPRSGSSPHST